MSRIQPVILCGGAGTRLWPLSREDRPKQLLALTGGETMLRLTLARVRDEALFEPPMLVGSVHQAERLEAEMRAAGIERFTLLLEPCARDTAAAIALAAHSARPDQPMLVMPSDHLILDPSLFLAGVTRAAPLAAEGWLTTFGIAPTRPETGFGYIRRGRALGPGLFEASRFVEKPDRATAEAYLAEGGHEWNAGIFLFRADAFLAELARHAPAIAETTAAALAGAVRAGNHILPDARSFADCPKRSVDYAVMEQAQRVAVVPLDLRWSDVGGWNALHEVSGRDDSGNAVTGPATTIEASNCLLHSTGPRIVALGVEDLVIVSTGDTVLVVPREKGDLVKAAVERLRAEAPELLFAGAAADRAPDGAADAAGLGESMRQG